MDPPPAPAKPAVRPALAGPDVAASARRWLGQHVQLHLPRDFDAADLGQGRCAGGAQAHYGHRFELFLRVVRKYGNVDPSVEVNLDRTFAKIEEHRRKHSVDALSRNYGSTFRNEMKALLEKLDAGEGGALNAWIDKWTRRVVPRADIRV